MPKVKRKSFSGRNYDPVTKVTRIPGMGIKTTDYTKKSESMKKNRPSSGIGVGY